MKTNLASNSSSSSGRFSSLATWVVLLCVLIGICDAATEPQASTLRGSDQKQQMRRALEDAKKIPTTEDFLLNDPKAMMCDMKCPAGQLAFNVNVAEDSHTMLSHESMFSTIKPIFKCMCLEKCRNVCRSFSIKCTGEYDWTSFENKRCYQFEKMQGTGPISALFLRTSCRCPSRDYSVSDSCAPATQANLSNCIIGEITSVDQEINFGTLSNVQIGRVSATGTDDEGKPVDIDFQGDASGSHFCELEADGDIEFGGEACPIQFSDNSVMSIQTGLDFQFEEGTWVGPNNRFGDLDIGDDWQFNGSAAATRETKIWNNSFGDVEAGMTPGENGKCNYNDGHAVGDADIYGNSCSTFVIPSDGDCDDVYDGFDCV